MNKRKKAEFGDFQTPSWLARQVTALLAQRGMYPAAVLEPTCGQGSFLWAAYETFPTAAAFAGLDVNTQYVQTLKQHPLVQQNPHKFQLQPADFFYTDWKQILETLPDPLLIIGNPPWATNSALSVLESGNLPAKTNFQGQNGIEAITGASNFDISEWMLLRMMEWVEKRQAIIAMLCKTAVARKLLQHIWQAQPAAFPQTALYLIDSQKAFNVSVDACLFVYDTRTAAASRACPVFNNLTALHPQSVIGFHEKKLIANVTYYRQWQHLSHRQGQPSRKWRSGIKHDCVKVMELQKEGNFYRNKLGESVELEDKYLYPLLKGSDLARKEGERPSRWLLVPQQFTGENTQTIRFIAPKTWAYLQAHAACLDNRKSVIYKNRPRFSIFGVGDYSFAPWKVAVSGMSKQIWFTAVGPQNDKPIMLDDTCYFLPCQSEEEAELLTNLLNADAARQFFQAFIFWDAKRPITGKILQQLDILALAKELNKLAQLQEVTRTQANQPRQLPLFESKELAPG